MSHTRLFASRLVEIVFFQMGNSDIWAPPEHTKAVCLGLIWLVPTNGAHEFPKKDLDDPE